MRGEGGEANADGDAEPVSAMPTRPPRAGFSLPMLGNTVGIAADPLGFQDRQHRNLGPVFSADLLGRRLVFVDVVGRPALGQELFEAPADTLDMVGAYRDLLGELLGAELFVSVAKELRVPLAMGYVRRHLPRSTDLALGFFDKQIDSGSGVDLVRICSDLVIHFVCDYLTGGELRESERSELAELFDVIESDYSVLGMLSPIETRGFRRRVAARKRAHRILRSALERRLHSSAPVDDFVQGLIAAGHAQFGGSLSEPAIEAISLQLLGMVFAAHTNTAMTLALCLAEVSRDPKLFGRLRRSVIDAGMGADSRSVQSAPPPIIHRVVTECIRLHSIGTCWRKASRALDLGGFRIQAGEYVGTSLGRINLDPRRYPDPEVFDVDRSEDVPRDRFESPPVQGCPVAFAGFGSGRYLCSGRTLAYSMLGGLLSCLVRDYEWQIEREPRLWYPLMFPGLSRPIGALRATVRRVRAPRDDHPTRRDGEFLDEAASARP